MSFRPIVTRSPVAIFLAIDSLQAPAGAVTQAATASSPSWELAGDLLRTIGALAAVCAVLFAVFRLAGPRLFGSAPRGASRLAVLERTHIGGKNWVCVIATAERRFLVGVSESRVTLLSDLGRSADAASSPRPVGPRSEREGLS